MARRCLSHWRSSAFIDSVGDDLSIDDLQDLIGTVNLPAGSRVSSHLLAFDPAGSRNVSGIEIVFDAPVLAVITADQTLFDTHALFGREGLNYPGFVNLYGFEPGSEMRHATSLKTALSWATDSDFCERSMPYSFTMAGHACTHTTGSHSTAQRKLRGHGSA